MASAQDDADLTEGVPGAVRLTDVAREAGVGIATASRALGNPERVNAKTRQRVLKAAQKLGYTTNIAARSLRSGLSRIVLVVTPPWSGLNVLQPALVGIDAQLMKAGYSMIMGSLAEDRSADPRIIDMARGGFVDGIIAITNDPTKTGELPILSARLPSVGLLMDLSGFGVPSVVVAEREGIRQLTEHLIARGRRRLMYVGGLPGYHDVERLAGFNDAVHAAPAPIEAIYRDGDYSTGEGIRTAEAFLSLADRPDGVVLTNDWMAIAFMATLRRAGVRIPEDVSVTGFDNIGGSAFSDPPLTTYHQPMQGMGAEAARMLLQLIAGEPLANPGRTIFAGDVVLRGSA
jgi:LacI family repressor for deo operon, udp, cdd, tsx, nupC, and nupG